MASGKRLIDYEQAKRATYEEIFWTESEQAAVRHFLAKLPKVDAVEVVHGERIYNAHEVAVIIADLFRDDCACNFNSIDEWLPFKCELQDACPNPVGVACWEQYLKYRDAKMDGERKDNGTSKIR